MRLTGFHIDGFGVLNDVGADGLSPGLTVILGDNGAGKSTLLEFLRAVLFGFRDRRTDAPRYEPLRGGNHGGSLDVEMADGCRYRVARAGDRPVRGVETVASLSDDGPNRDLAAILGGASEDVYYNVFAFSLAELTDVSTLDKGKVQERLYAAGAGTGAKAAPDVRKKIEETAKTLYSQRGRSALGEILQEIEGLRTRRAALSGMAEEYARLNAESGTLAAEMDRVANEEAAAAGRLRECQALVDAWGDWEALQGGREALEALGDVRPLPERAEERLASAVGAVKERAELAAEADARAAAAHRDITEDIARLGPEWTEERVSALDVSEKSSISIQAHGQVLAAAADEVTRADAGRRNAETAAGRSAADREALEVEERTRWPEQPRIMERIEADLETVRKARAEAAHLVEERGKRSELEGRRHAAEGDVRRLREAPEPIAPPARIPLIVAIGALACASVVFRISLPAALALVAVFVVAAAIAIRGHRRARSLVRAQRAEEIREAEGKVRDLDDRIAAADESIGKRQAALNSVGSHFGIAVVGSPSEFDVVERRLTEERDSAAAFAAFGERLRAARKAEAEAADKLDIARRALADAEAAQGDARRDWATWLRGEGMDEGLAPDAASRFIEQVRSALGKLAVRAQRRSEAESAHRRAAEAREQVRSLIAEAGDQDEAAFGEHARRWHELEDARARAAATENRLEARAGSPERWAAMREALLATDRDALEAQRSETESTLSEVRARRDAMSKRLGEVAGDMKRLEASREQEVVAAQIADLTRQAQEILEQWAVQVLCAGLLDQARDKFERDRQPAVIMRAGNHLRRITDGGYVRLIRRLETGALEAEPAQGAPKDRTAWNRGLLEQVYLSLRLGFIEEYCGSAEPLPAIMDDVFANFDPQHARRAAAAVCDFARTHQVLYLTCHPETAAHFGDLSGRQAGILRLQGFRVETGDWSGI